jgi:hypothetical protein
MQDSDITCRGRWGLDYKAFLFCSQIEQPRRHKTHTHVPFVVFQKPSVPKALFSFPFTMKESFKCQVNSNNNCVDSNANNSYATDVGSKRKTVRFAPEPQVLNFVDTLGELSDKDRLHTWWQRDEHERSRASTRSLCRKMRQTGGSNGGLIAAYSLACCITASEFDLDSVHSAQVYTLNEVSMCCMS